MQYTFDDDQTHQCRCWHCDILSIGARIASSIRRPISKLRSELRWRKKRREPGMWLDSLIIVNKDGTRVTIKHAKLVAFEVSTSVDLPNYVPLTWSPMVDECDIQIGFH